MIFKDPKIANLPDAWLSLSTIVDHCYLPKKIACLYKIQWTIPFLYIQWKVIESQIFKLSYWNKYWSLGNLHIGGKTPRKKNHRKKNGESHGSQRSNHSSHPRNEHKYHPPEESDSACLTFLAGDGLLQTPLKKTSLKRLLKNNIVGGCNPSEKYYLNWESSPNRGENKKYLKPPPR